MTFTYYTQGVLATESPVSTAIQQINNNSFLRQHHAIVGLMTEAVELKEWQLQNKGTQNLFEECGDCLWYLSLLHDALGEKSAMESFFFVDPDLPGQIDAFDQLFIAAGNMLDMHKKFIFYPREIDFLRFEGWIIEAVFAVRRIIRDHGLSVESVRAGNNRKLLTGTQARYDETFSTDKANNRDVVAEMASMEGETTN